MHPLTRSASPTAATSSAPSIPRARINTLQARKRVTNTSSTADHCVHCNALNIITLPLAANPPNDIRQHLTPLSKQIESLVSVSHFQEVHYNAIIAIQNTQILSLQNQIKSLQEKVDTRGRLLEKAKRELQSRNGSLSSSTRNHHTNNDFKFKFKFNPIAESTMATTPRSSRSNSFTTFKPKFKPPSSSMVNHFL